MIGRNMVIKTPNGRKSQEWYFDQKSRTIRSMYRKNWSWDIQGAGRSSNMQAYNTNSKWFQLFKFDGSNTFFNIYNDKVLDVAGGRDEEGNNVQVWRRNKSKAQQWKLIYVDKAKKPSTKGFDKDYGMERNRPFYLISKLPMERVVECWGASNIILSDLVNGKLGQQFFYDGVSKTIKSQQWKDRSLTIQSNGRSANLYMTTTNSRWF